MKTKRIVFLYMKALEEAKLPIKTWKKLARVNQLVLDYKSNKQKNGGN